MATKKDNYLGARLTLEVMQYLKQDFPDNLSQGIQKSIDVYRNAVMLALVEIRAQKFNEQELKAIIQLKNLNQSIDDATLDMLAKEHGADPDQLRKKIGSLGRIEKYIMFEQLALYEMEQLKKRFDVK